MSTQKMNSNFLPLIAAILLLLLTAWIYWPGISGPALLDDRASVMVLDALDDNPEFSKDYIFGDRAGPLGRPVSMLSFVLEKLYLNEGIRGGKKVNIALHLINGCLLIYLLTLLLNHVRAPKSRWLALLAGSAWLLSPLYVSTVLYVVQRMAMLASFFMLAAFISYAYWRMALLRGEQRNICLVLVFTFLVLGVFSKETAIVGVPILLLMECLWFQFSGPDGRVYRELRLAVLGLIVGGSVFVLMYFIFWGEGLLAGYHRRTFSLSERVLTQSRILWDYLGQLLLPEVSRMGLFHDDIVISRSLLEPVATLYSVLAWLAVLALSVGLLKWQWGCYLVFALVIFFVGHSTESTVLPLELYYEHRNYFPGIGLFLGIALLLAMLFRKWPEIATPALVWGGVFVVVLAMRTSSQVQIWSSAPLLYLTHVNGHPNSFRANADMASLLAELGALEEALEYSAKAHKARPEERQGDYDIRDLALSCGVNQPLPPERIAAIGLVDKERPLSSVSTLNVLVRQLQDNKCPNFDRVFFADQMAAIFLGDQYGADGDWRDLYGEKASPNIYASLAVLENALERYDNAHRYTEMFLAGAPGNIRGMLMKLHFATALQKNDEIASVMAKLVALEEAGVLTLQDRQTLSLYKEN